MYVYIFILYVAASYSSITVFTPQYICFWACIFKNANEFNLNIYRLAVYLRL